MIESLLALSMLAFTILFAVFIYKELGGVRFGRDFFYFLTIYFFAQVRNQMLPRYQPFLFLYLDRHLITNKKLTLMIF